MTAGGPLRGSGVGTASPLVRLLPPSDGATDEAAGAALAEALRAGDPNAAQALFDRHAVHVRTVLVSVLGPDPDIADLIQDVFVIALEGIARLRDGRKLNAWLTSIAVFKARGLIRSRRRQRMLASVCFWMAEEAPDPTPAIQGSHTLRAAWRVLERLPADERLAFALRFVQGLELAAAAAACEVSLATIKRRLERAQAAFLREARHEPALVEFLKGVSPWNQR